MRRVTDLPELLAPAGDMECLAAAISAGADAVYLGGLKFGARAFAKNFSPEELSWAVKLCHLHGVRLYVTLNTLIYDKEIEEAVAYAESLHRIGVDALIVADLGIASLIRERIPDLEIHASTQMGVHNRAGADVAYSLGAARVVLARECSGADIKKITEEAKPEIEVFLHGALCVCHSGQCLFSSMVGGRSGNRGECAQPCRLPYNNGKYILSLKDLSLANHIKELVSSGVSSLKIEGRMKSPSYVFEVTSIYRRLLDECREATREENARLSAAFSRGGFTDGYFTSRIASGMTGVRSEDDKQASKSVEAAGTVKPLPKIKLDMKCELHEGAPAVIYAEAEVSSRIDRASSKISATALSDSPEAARSAPLTPESVSERLAKLGATPFVKGECSVAVDEGINLSPSSLNALRREACDGLLASLGKPLDDLIGKKRLSAPRVTLNMGNTTPVTRKITALFHNTDALSELITKDKASLSGMDIAFVPLFDIEKINPSAYTPELGVYIPPVIMESEWEEVKSALSVAVERGASSALLGNISHIELIKDTPLKPYGDLRLNTSNAYSRAALSALGVDDIILSPELTLPMARDIGGAVVTLGRLPLMLTERCFIKENFGCDKCGKAALADRKGMRFPMMREWGHRNVIFNSAHTYMGDRADELRSARITSEHYIFSVENASEIRSLLSAKKKGASLNLQVRRIGKR